MKKRLIEAVLRGVLKHYNLNYTTLIISQRKGHVLAHDYQMARGGFLWVCMTLIGDNANAAVAVGADRGNGARYRRYYLEHSDSPERLALTDSVQKELAVAFGQRRIEPVRGEV